MPVPPSLIKLAAALGPGAVRAVRGVGPLIANNPDAVRQGRELLDKALAARQGHTKEERLRRTIAALREEAVRSEAAASEPAEKDQAAGWIRRVDALQAALGLAELRSGAARRNDLSRLQARVDDLFAEVFTAAVRDEDAGSGRSRRRSAGGSAGGPRA